MDAILVYNPPLLEPDPESSPSPIVSPLTFYDKHVGITLRLKRVLLLSSLLADISSQVDSVRRCMQDMGLPLPCRFGMFTSAEDRRTERKTIYDADELAGVYEKTTASDCLCVATTIYLTPRASAWEALILLWRKENPRREAWSYHTVKASLQVNPRALGSPDYKPAIDESTKQTLLEVAKRFPEVAIWSINMISDESQSLFEQMDRVASSRPFRSHVPLTKGHIPLPQPSVQRFLPDARNMPWTFPTKDKASDGSRRSTRTHNITRSTHLLAAPKGSTRKVSTGLKPGSITLPSEFRANERRNAEHGYIKSPEHLLQHVSTLKL